MWNFNWSSLIGPALIALGLVFNGFVTLIRKDQDVANLSKWKTEHEIESRKRDEGIAELKTIAAAMKATAQGQERRLEMLEDRI